MSEEKIPAISVCLFDPSGKQTGETFPAGSVWDWRDGRKHRKQRSDAGTGATAKERQARHRNRFVSQDKQKTPIENTGDTDAIAA